MYDKDVTFTQLSEAIAAGYQIYDRDSHGFMIRIQTASHGWAYGIVRPS